MSLQVDVVRVFTDAEGRLGNELGLVSTPVPGREQAIATELGFSETVFIESVSDDRATIRIFTPASELPFAGHPSVGTAWWFAHSGTPVAVLAEKAGDVAVRTDSDLTWITGEPAWAPEFTFHPTSSAAAIEALDPVSFTTGQHFAWAYLDESAGRIRARMFAPAMGILEDQATGAAAVRLTGLLERDLEIVQGAGCVIRTRWLGGRVEVGGRTVYDRAIELD